MGNPEKIARYIGASARAIQQAQPGSSDREAQIAAIRESDEIPWIDLESLGPPDTEASERQLWMDPESGMVLKATAYGRFRHDFDRRASGADPLNYLERLALANEVFGDDIQIIGKFLNLEGAIGLVHSQNFVVGHAERPNPTVTEVEDFLAKGGFRQVVDYPGRYANHSLGLEIDDTHSANLSEQSMASLYRSISCCAGRVFEGKKASLTGWQSWARVADRRLGPWDRPDAFFTDRVCLAFSER